MLRLRMIRSLDVGVPVLEVFWFETQIDLRLNSSRFAKKLNQLTEKLDGDTLSFAAPDRDS
jgi:hypothetical protein